MWSTSRSVVCAVVCAITGSVIARVIAVRIVRLIVVLFGVRRPEPPPWYRARWIEELRLGPPHSRLQLCINLCALQRARVIDVDRLPLREYVDSGDARFAVAVPGLLDAAERQVHLGADRGGVHVE